MTRIDELVREHLGWGMHFSPELEREYRRHHAERSVAPLRVGLTFILLLMLLAGTPWIADPEMRRLNFVVCVLVLSPVLVLMILATFSKQFARFSQILMALLAMLMTLSFDATMPVGSAEFYARHSIMPTLFVVFGVFTIARLRFWNAVGTAALLCASTIATINLVRPLPAEIQMENVLYLAFAYVLGVAAAYPTDRALRRDFLLSRLLMQEKERSETLLSNVLPDSISDRLKEQGGVIAEGHASVSVLFADVVNFTPFAATHPPAEVVGYLNRIFSQFDELVQKYGLEKIKTVGDAYMVAGGLPLPQEGHLAGMAGLALDMLEVMSETNGPHGAPMQIRIGIHSGPLVAGVIGTKKLLYDLWGDTVNTASRMESHGIAGHIQVTEEVVRQLSDRFEFEDRGSVPVKGLGTLRTFWLIGRKREAFENSGYEVNSTSPTELPSGSLTTADQPT